MDQNKKEINKKEASKKDAEIKNNTDNEVEKTDNSDTINSDKSKTLKIVIPIIAILVISVIVAVVFKISKDNGGYASTTNKFIVYATDENGIAITDDAGACITYVAEPTYIIQTTERIEFVTNKDGAVVTDKNGENVTKIHYENVTNKDGTVLTTIAYKEVGVTVNVPVTDKNGVTETEKNGAVVTEQITIPQNPNDARPGEGVVMGTTIINFTDGKGNTNVDDKGDMLTSVVHITSNPHEVAPASIDWKKSFGGTEADYFSAVDSDKNGNLIAAIVTNSKNGDFAQFSSLKLATPYSVITKYNTKGNIDWTIAAGSRAGNHVITDIICTSDGGFYAVGYGTNVGGEFLPSDYYYDGFVYKYDSNGKELWHKIFKTTTVDAFSAGALTDDGGIVVVGTVGNNDGDAAGFNMPAYKSALCAVKYSSTGKLVWKNIFGGNKDALEDVCIGSDNNIYCVGNFYSGKLFKSLGKKSDGGVVKLSSSGKFINAVPLAGNNNDLFSGITACKNGGVAVVGSSNSNDSDSIDSIFTGDMASRGGYDSYIIKLNNDLSIAFAKPFRGQNDDELVDIIERDDGTFVATGSSNSSSRDFKGITTRGGDDMVIAAFDMYGNLKWARSFGGTANETAYAICRSPKGGYAVVGSTLSKNIDMAGIAQYVTGLPVGVIVKFPE